MIRGRGGSISDTRRRKLRDVIRELSHSERDLGDFFTCTAFQVNDSRTEIDRGTRLLPVARTLMAKIRLIVPSRFALFSLTLWNTLLQTSLSSMNFL